MGSLPGAAWHPRIRESSSITVTSDKFKVNDSPEDLATGLNGPRVVRAVGGVRTGGKGGLSQGATGPAVVDTLVLAVRLSLLTSVLPAAAVVGLKVASVCNADASGTKV